MGVVVDEMTSEIGSPAAPAAASATGGGDSGPARDVDMDRLEYAMRRQQQRVQRLWAD